MELKGRIISRGTAEGEAIVTKDPISFYGGVDPDTGEVIDTEHELKGQSIKGKILVFPTGKGSTVGSYVLYRLKKGGSAPAGIINSESETIVAVGAIISNIPLVDKVDISQIKTGQKVRIKEEGVVEVE